MGGMGSCFELEWERSSGIASKDDDEGRVEEELKRADDEEVS